MKGRGFYLIEPRDTIELNTRTYNKANEFSTSLHEKITKKEFFIALANCAKENDLNVVEFSQAVKFWLQVTYNELIREKYVEGTVYLKQYITYLEEEYNNNLVYYYKNLTPKEDVEKEVLQWIVLNQKQKNTLIESVDNLEENKLKFPLVYNYLYGIDYKTNEPEYVKLWLEKEK